MTDDPADGPDPDEGEDPVRVRAEESPVDDEPPEDPEADPEPEPEPNPYEEGPGHPEPGLTGLLFRAGDRLAYKGDKWEARINDDPQAAPTPPPPPVFVGTFTVAGKEVPWDMHEWAPDERRLGSLLTAALASFLVVLGIAAQFVAPTATWFLTLLLVGLVVLLSFELAVFLTAEPAPAPAAAPAGAAAGGAQATQEWEETSSEAEEPQPQPEPEPEEEPAAEDEPLDILTLKCSECGEVFDVEDHGQRPLEHACPGCGAQGEIPTSELPDPADLREEDDEPEAPAGEIPDETGDPIPEFNLDDDEEQA